MEVSLTVFPEELSEMWKRFRRRAEGWKEKSLVLKHHKTYTTMRKMPGWHAVSALPKNRGLVVNPGLSVGFTLGPEELRKMREKLRLGG